MTSEPEDRISLTPEEWEKLTPLVDIFLRSSAKKPAAYFDLFMAAANHVTDGVREFKYITRGMLDAADMAMTSEKASIRRKAILLLGAATGAVNPAPTAVDLAYRAVDALTRVLDHEASRVLRMLAAHELRNQRRKKLAPETKIKIMDIMLGELANPNREMRERAIITFLDPAMVQKDLFSGGREPEVVKALNKAIDREHDGSLRLTLQRARDHVSAICGNGPKAQSPLHL